MNSPDFPEEQRLDKMLPSILTL